MKGVQGLVIAIVLGVIGAAVNWKYLSDESKQGKYVTFVIVKSGKTVQAGEKFRLDDLEEVQIPEHLAGPLQEIAAKDIKVVALSRATLPYKGPSLVYRDDLRTPSSGALPLDPKTEFAFAVPIDRNFVSSLIIPGKTPVKFYLPREGTPPGAADIPMELVGPYEVLTVGNRRGEEDTMRAGSIRPMQEHVLMIRGRPDKLTSRLVNYRNRSGNKPLDVVLCSEAEPEK